MPLRLFGVLQGNVLDLLTHSLARIDFEPYPAYQFLLMQQYKLAHEPDMPGYIGPENDTLHQSGYKHLNTEQVVCQGKEMHLFPVTDIIESVLSLIFVHFWLYETVSTPPQYFPPLPR